jgi:Tfp pilus assembly protein PilZ
MTNSERRRHSRTEVHLAARLARAASEEASTMRDVSIGGAFVQTSAKCAYGEPVVLHVRLPGLDEEVALPGTVRWVSEDGCGIQFAPIGARETHAIVELSRRA